MSEFQADDIEVNGDSITGTLYDFEGWGTGPLAGEGHFIAVKFDDIPETATGVAVGLVPSASGMEMQELDSDKDAVFKIADKNRQQLVVKIHDDDSFTIYTYDLTGLKYEEPGA